MADSAILLISCSDRRGLVAAVTDFISNNNGNILHLDQHVDSEQNVFFMRVEWDLNGFALERDMIHAAFRPISERFDMTWRLRFSQDRLRMAVFVSKQSHCLHDILARWHSGELRADIPFIASNHPKLETVASTYGIPFKRYPITKENKQAQEQAQLQMLGDNQIDIVVLARYMQIVTEQFVAAYPNRIINIHHSFLPAFAGAKPYHRAYERGVKIIGATSHYVTPDLDAGPIIAQGVTNVSHKDSVSDMIRKGKDLEKTVLARALWHHLQHRILVYNNKTVVFE